MKKKLKQSFNQIIIMLFMEKSKVHDCHGCTVPASSGNKGIEITNILHSRGKNIFGWDMEWEINWDQNRFK